MDMEQKHTAFRLDPQHYSKYIQVLAHGVRLIT
jgi:hypothetical protein